MTTKNENFRILQQLTLKEIIILALLTFIKGAAFKKYLFYFLALVVATITLGGLAGPAAFSFESIMSILLPALIVAFLFLVFFILITVIVYYSEKKQSKEIFIRFSHWGIIKEMEGKETSSPWRNAKSLVETTNYFLIFMKPAAIVPIQKRMFLNESEIEEFRSFIKENISVN